MVGALALFLLSPQIPDARDVYAAAGKLLRDPSIEIATRIRYHQLDNVPSTLPKGLSLTTTPLEAVRWQSKTLAQVLAMVEKGNDLPLSPPPPPTIDSVVGDFPDIAAQKQIAKAISDYAWLKVSEGRSAEATQALVATEEMAFRTADESLMHYLVSVAIESIVLAFVNEFLSVFTPSDWEKLETISNRRLADKGLIGRVYEGELKQSMVFDEYLRKDLPSKDILTSATDGDSDEFNDAVTRSFFKSLTKERWLAILDRVAQKKRMAVDGMKLVLTGPESEWKFAEPESEEKLPKVIRMDSDLVRHLSATFAARVMAVPLFKSRVQYRLLLLHGRVRTYFWNYRKYPDSLKDVATAAEIFDPLSGKPFVYEKLETGYKLVSSGRPGLIGEVALKYRRPPNSQNDRADGPP